MRTPAFVAALLLFSSCQAPPPEPPPPEMTDEEIAAEVEMVLDDWWATWSGAEDFDGFMAFFADDPDLLWISDAEPYFGRAEMDAAFRPGYENMQGQENTPIEWRTIVIAPDVVYTVRINHIVQTDIAGNSVYDHPYAETLVWVKRDGEWKMLAGHGSSPNDAM